MTYTVIIVKKAKKQLAKAPKRNQAQILAALATLKSNPRNANTKKLAGKEFYRIRAGVWRAIYKIEDSQVTVEVIKVGHRKQVYRGL